jgi:UDP-N-acetylglucosamine pyrophosphorylase
MSQGKEYVFVANSDNLHKWFSSTHAVMSCSTAKLNLSLELSQKKTLNLRMLANLLDKARLLSVSVTLGFDADEISSACIDNIKYYIQNYICLCMLRNSQKIC